MSLAFCARSSSGRSPRIARHHVDVVVGYRLAACHAVVLVDVQPNGREGVVDGVGNAPHQPGEHQRLVLTEVQDRRRVASRHDEQGSGAHLIGIDDRHGLRAPLDVCKALGTLLVVGHLAFQVPAVGTRVPYRQLDRHGLRSHTLGWRIHSSPISWCTPCPATTTQGLSKVAQHCGRWADGMVEGMDGGQFLWQESRLGGRNDEGNPITTLERPEPPHCWIARATSRA